MTKILVVDDDTTNRKLLVALLGFEGYEMLQASDGAEALRVAREHHPRLVISDILMPTMDGYEFVRRLREAPELAATAVIFYTANYHERAAHSLAAKIDAERVIVKPCESAEFLRIVKSTLGQAPRPAAVVPYERFETEHLQLLTDKLSGTVHELGETNARLAALVELNLQLASERNPRVLLQKVCAGARDLIGARVAMLAALDRSHSDSLFVATSGIETSQEIFDASLDNGLLGRVMKERRAVRASNLSSALTGVGLPSSLGPVSAVLAAPVTSLKRTYGWICLADKVGAAEFSAEDERLLTILGAQVGRIYENGSLYLEVQNQAARLLVEMEERERASAGLRASEELFRQLADNIQDVLFIASADLQTLFFVSPAFEAVWGQPQRALLDNRHAWVEALHPDDRASALREQQRIAATLPERGVLEFRIIRPDGAVRWISTRIFPIADEHGTVVRACGISTDMTERKLVENRNTHLTRMHAMLSGINSLIVRATQKQDLLREACRLALDPGHFYTSWCGIVDRTSGAVTVSATASRSAAMETLFQADHRGEIKPTVLVGRAMARREPAICNDIRSHGTEIDIRDALLEQGCRSIAALPLIVGNDCVGCLVLVSSEEDFFDEEEMRLLNELAGDISFALDHIDKAERLNYLAYYDPLTGLANRSSFLLRLSQHVSAGIVSGDQFAIVVADPERFAALNDTLGRTAADQLLRALSQRFADCAGGPDLVGRIGSDQLAAVIPRPQSNTDLTRAVQSLWKHWLDEPFLVNGQNVSITARAGIALFPSDGTDAEILLRNAEAALRSAKSSSQIFATYTPALSERIIARLAFDKNIRHALENEEFVLHYQPKVDLGQRRVQGLEALIRWNSPELGLVSPATFIPLVEENGMIVEIGAWVLRQASLDRARWIEKGLNAPRVAVNVSVVQLRQDDFVRKVSTVVRLAGGAQAGIDIEVTESILMGGAAENLQKLAAIRELGVNIALDDFGTGYSSLAYLSRLPVQTLKIDRSFVSTMLEEPDAMTLVSTIISLARALKLETVAEGVESEDQAKILRLLQCDQMQGYLVSKPLPVDEMTTFLSRTRPQ